MRTITFKGTVNADWYLLNTPDALLVADGGAGNDGLQGGGLADQVHGGAGNDQLWGFGGDDQLWGDDGNDQLWGGTGNDTLDGGNGDDQLWGGDGNDSLSLGDGNDQAWGEDGSDRIATGGGNDIVWAGTGDDSVDGGTGNDTIFAEAGNDSIQAGEGDNSVSGGSGDDTLRAGAGNDTLGGDDGNDVIGTGDGNNIAWGGTGNDTITGGNGRDLLTGDDGADRITAGGGDDTVYGGQGDDTVDAGDGNDLVTGDNGNDSLAGGDGNDTIYGGEGNDTILAGAGADVVNADGGDDLVVFSSGGQVGDRFDGGVGTDTLRLDLTRAEWFSAATQTELAGFLAKLAKGDTSPFCFNSLGLKASQFEKVGVTVEGRVLTAENDPVIARADSYTVSEDDILTGNVLDNDKVPDLVASLTLQAGPAKGALQLNQDGSFSLDARAAFQSLAEGQSATLTFRYLVTDADGSTGSATATVVVQGANDTAAISGSAKASLAEDGALAASGKLAVTDIDAGQAAFAKAAALAGSYGSFTFDDASGAWTYALNNAAANVQALKAGQVVQDVLKVASLDGTASQDIVVSITGANDAASISGTAKGSVTEDGTLAASGKLGVTDADAGEAGFAKAAALAGTYGNFTFDDASGAWTYALNNAAANVQALKAGQVVQDVLKVASLDGTATQDIVVSITGANDAASISGTAKGSVTEDGTLAASGKLGVTDADAGQAGFAKAAALAGTYGNFTFDDASGAWTYALNNAAANVQALKAGQVVQDVLKVASLDGTASQDIVVSITGADEPAAPSGNILINGGFEAPEIAPYLNNWMPRSDLVGWKSTAGAVEVWNNFLVKPSEGNQNIEIDWSNARDAIFQQVDAKTDVEYTLSFDAQARRAGQATSESFEVLWNEEVLGTINPTFGKWTSYRFEVEGKPGMDKLTFRELAEGNDGLGGLLDNVALVEWHL